MTCVILTGGIDLSVGSVLALSTALCAGFITNGVPVGLAMVLALIIGTALGAVSGLLVTKGRLQPFIATLITMTVYRGATMIFMDGKPISNLGDSFTLKVVGKGNFYHIPIPAITFVVMFLIFMFVLEKTTFGRRVYATGSNEPVSYTHLLRKNRAEVSRVSIFEYDEEKHMRMEREESRKNGIAIGIVKTAQKYLSLIHI